MHIFRPGKSLPVVEEDVWDPEVLGMDDHGADLAVLAAVPRQLIVLPALTGTGVTIWLIVLPALTGPGVTIWLIVLTALPGPGSLSGL
jgi:hypothetical protein